VNQELFPAEFVPQRRFLHIGHGEPYIKSNTRGRLGCMLRDLFARDAVPPQTYLVLDEYSPTGSTLHKARAVLEEVTNQPVAAVSQFPHSVDWYANNHLKGVSAEEFRPEVYQAFERLKPSAFEQLWQWFLSQQQQKASPTEVRKRLLEFRNAERNLNPQTPLQVLTTNEIYTYLKSYGGYLAQPVPQVEYRRKHVKYRRMFYQLVQIALPYLEVEAVRYNESSPKKAGLRWFKR